MANQINYTKRTFSEIKEDLVNYVKDFYPEIYRDFTDASVGSMLLDLNAGVSNNLQMNLDRVFQETQLNNSQQRRSLLNIAKTYGLKIPNKRPSVTVVDFSIEVPVNGDQPDSSYYPTISPSSQVVGGGATFETIDIIDFSSPVNALGSPNRAIIPIKNSNGIITSYSITKSEIVVNGETRIHKRIIRGNESREFFNFILPDPDVLSIDRIIQLEGTNYSNNPDESQFQDIENIFYEVDTLSDQRVFVENRNAQSEDIVLKSGSWIDITKKFTKEFTDSGLCKIQFGSGDNTLNILEDGLIKQGVTSNRIFLNNLLNNTSLGEKLKRDSTVFVRYRTGGGSRSNVGTDVLTKKGIITMTVKGSRDDINRNVKNSLSITNTIPAIGGNDGLSIEEIRNLISYNYSKQNRNVTLNDYLTQVYLMDGKFGAPFKVTSSKENNKVVISILGLDSEGKLNNTSNSLLKGNIAEYLSNFRTINDYIEIRDGRIYNLGLNVELFVSNENETTIANNVIRAIANFFDINKNRINEDILLDELRGNILDVESVLNVLNISVYNNVGGVYSQNTTEQEIIDTTTGEIKIINNTLYSSNDSMFEIKYPNKDIRVSLKKRK